MIAPRLENADDERIDEINNVYDYALENGLGFYCVTGSSAEAIATWSDNTGAEYPFLMADDVLLKTIVNGYLEGNTDWKAKEDARLITNLLSFTVPLLLVWGYDALRNRRRRKGKESE